VNYVVVHEVEMGRWEPLGVIEPQERDWIGAAIARLEWRALPGVFRLFELESGGWLEVELAADGVVVE